MSENVRLRDNFSRKTPRPSIFVLQFYIHFAKMCDPNRGRSTFVSLIFHTFSQHLVDLLGLGLKSGVHVPQNVLEI